jgi:sugar lactone lactonase YvrE
VPHRVSLLVQPKNDDTILILAVDNGLLKFNIDKNTFERLTYLEDTIIDNRSNDGACDTNGNLWLGTMHLNCMAACGKLYCIKTNLQAEEKITKTTISNGLCWSLENDRMYYIDSASYKVACYLFNAETAEIIFEKTAVAIPPELGMPDGMAIDVEGMLWIAHWGGYGVYRWNPENGELLDKILLPVPNITSCVFGGNKFNQLFITTARSGLSLKELEQYPLSGSIFIATTNVTGFVKNKFTLW